MEDRRMESLIQSPKIIESNIELLENQEKYIIYYLYEDEEQSVLVDEVDELDFQRVINHLGSGGSIFIKK
jgi:hypothetical protein